jgi:hypothetical protein
MVQCVLMLKPCQDAQEKVARKMLMQKACQGGGIDIANAINVPGCPGGIGIDIANARSIPLHIPYHLNEIRLSELWRDIDFHYHFQLIMKITLKVIIKCTEFHFQLLMIIIFIIVIQAHVGMVIATRAILSLFLRLMPERHCGIGLAYKQLPCPIQAYRI